MNSEDVHHDTSAQAQPEQAVSSPGAMLRQAREKQGLSQQNIADRIFVKVHTVDDIENDKIDGTMSVTFTKGYVRNYAKQLGIDDALIIKAFESTHTTTEPPAQLQSFSQKVAKQAHDDRWMMVTYVIFFLLAAGVVAWWYQQDDGMSDESVSAVQEDTTETSGVTASPRTSAPATRRDAESGSAAPTIETQLPATADNNDSEQSDTAQSAANEPQRSPQSSAEPAQSTDSAQNDSAPAADATSVNSDNASATSSETAVNLAKMTFTFGEDCWVNIKGADGEVIATGIKREGRKMAISGQPPITVTLGAPDNVAVSYNGEAVDISQFQNGRTARFSLPFQE